MNIQNISFEKKKGKYVYLQIYDKIKEDILHGYLKKGDKLPSIRQCEQMWKVSRTSIEKAYIRLIDEGYVYALEHKGFYVDVEKESVALRKQLMQETLSKKQQNILFDLQTGTIDVELFDKVLWKKYLKEVLQNKELISTYGDAQGEYTLRLALQKYAYSMRGVLCDIKQILIGSSFQSLLYIICGMLPKNSVIAMESNSFIQAKRVFQDFGFTIKYISKTEDGYNMDELYRYDITLLYVHSGAFTSTYKPISKDKEIELLHWAEKTNSYILEDDHNGELRYRSRIQPSMQGMDVGKHVFYIGSFSRILPPAFRISYLVLPLPYLKDYEKRKKSYAPTASKIEQMALAQYIIDGHLEKHVKRLSKQYGKRCREMEDVLKEIFPNTSVRLEEAALCFHLELPKGNSKYIQSRLQEKGIYLNTANHHELMLSFASISQKNMRTALLYLKEIIDEMSCG